MGLGEQTAKNHCAAMVLEDYVNALWRVITALDFYKFKLEFMEYSEHYERTKSEL